MCVQIRIAKAWMFAMLAIIPTACGSVAGDPGDSLADSASAADFADKELAQVASLPSPYAFVSQLDFECQRISSVPLPVPLPVPPPVQQVLLRQLNPVLQGDLPNQVAQLGTLREMCLPVAKDGQIPTDEVLDFVSWADLACYEASAEPVDVTVALSHLNPVLSDEPDESVTMVELRRLCVPMRKNQSDIPDAARRLLQHLDLACYRLAQATEDANRNLTLSQLNPVIQEMPVGDLGVVLRRAVELCVPVGKNMQEIPQDVRRIIRWVDMLKYRTQVIDGELPVLPLLLEHMNPLFANLGPFVIDLLDLPPRVMVPVAKNQQFPPAD